jgi:hypothetical protein
MVYFYRRIKMSYEIYIRDSNLRRIGQVTDFTKLDLIPRFNALGSFVLDIPTDSAAARELIKPKYGIIVKKNGQTVMSGTVTGRGRAFTDLGDTLTLSGKDDNAYLAGRVVYPEVNGNFASQAYDVRTGKAETIMKQYVNYNAGPNALSQRRKVTIEADKGLGATVTGRGRFHNLLDFLTSLALSGGGLGFRVVQVNDSLEFQVYEPSDKTRSAFFSPLLSNLASFEYSQTDPTANFIIVGGGGEGSERVLLQKSDNASIADFDRWESFKDQRDTSEISELEQSLDEELANGVEQSSFSFVPIDTPQLAFGTHYNLGDKVSIVLTQPNEVVDIETLYYFISAYQTVPVQSERIRKIQEKLDVIQDIVREVKISITPNGEIINPVVGTSDSNNSSILGIFDKMKKLAKKINHLERV